MFINLSNTRRVTLKETACETLMIFAMLVLQSLNAGNSLTSSGEMRLKGFEALGEKSEFIQTLINLANDGDTIYISSGTYTENLKINKSIKLIANGTVEITPINLADNVIEILSNNVTLMGFTIINSRGIYGISTKGVTNYKIVGNKVLGGYSGLMINKSRNGMLMENEVTGCTFGMYFRESFENAIIRNSVELNKYGIILSLCFNNTINGNRIANCTYGLYNHMSDGNNIYENFLQENAIGASIIRSRENLIFMNEFLANFYGIIFDDAYRNAISKNNMSGGLIGIKIQESRNITISENAVRFSTNNIAIESSFNITVSSNKLEYAKGLAITIYETSYGIVSWNLISSCRVGISVESCRSLKVENNLMGGNEYGLYLFRSSETLLIYNRCFNNTIADFYSEGSENNIVKSLEMDIYSNGKEVSFTYQGDICVRGSTPIRLKMEEPLSGFFNITLLSPGALIKVNITYYPRDLRDARKEPVLYRWTGEDWKSIRGSVMEESPSKGLASFMLMDSGIYVLGAGEKLERSSMIIPIVIFLALLISSYLALKALKSRQEASG